MPFTIRFHQIESVNDALRNTVADIKDPSVDSLADTLSKPVARCLKARSGSTCDYTINPKSFDAVAHMHTDVWVDTSALHATLYTHNVKPSIPLPSASISYDPNSISRVRNFSGNVSGVIGEASFAWLMRYHYGIDSGHMVHLRPIKGAKHLARYPDFEIHNPTSSFLGDVPHVINHRTLFPFPCEVKGVTSPTRSNIKGQLKKAIVQLCSYWTFQGRPHCSGLISIALRNERAKAYDIVFVWVK